MGTEKDLIIQKLNQKNSGKPAGYDSGLVLKKDEEIKNLQNQQE